MDAIGSGLGGKSVWGAKVDRWLAIQSTWSDSLLDSSMSWKPKDSDSSVENSEDDGAREAWDNLGIFKLLAWWRNFESSLLIMN